MAAPDSRAIEWDAMIKDPEAFTRLAERRRARELRRMTVRQRIRIGEDLIRALFRHGVKPRRDRPRALSLYGKPDRRA
jgi:hypothetical protein